MKRLSGILLVLALSGTSYAWWSVGAGGALPSTHYRITTSAIELIRGTNDYPDITKFAGTIIGATSGFEDDAIAHGKDQDHPDAGKYNGGDFERWWRESKASYNRAEFLGELNAYYRIGSMAHLVEDHAVPAHAANVYHGNTLPIVGIPANPDDLEHYADGNGLGPRATVTAWYTVKEPLAYYYDEQNMAGSIVKNTQKKLPNWTWPGEWNDIQFIFNRSYWKARQYWYKNDWPQYQYTGQAFGEFGGNLTNTTQAGGWGYYGGTSGSDFYEYDFTGRLPVTDAPGIVQDQLDMAAAYSAGMLMAVSKSLPPIVKDLSLSEPNLVVGQSVQINFAILENRTSAATIYITVDDKEERDGSPIISAEYKTGVDKGPLGNISDSVVNALPFAGTFSIPWDGTMPGTPLDSGPHTLYVRASDADGNFSDAATVEFFLDAGGPRVSVGNMISTFYADYQGVSMVSPAGTNPAMLGIAGVDMQLLVRDESSGVKSIKLSRLAAVGDSAGTVVYSKLFTEPTGLYAEPALPLLADGPYRLEAEDWDGNRTVAPFLLGSIESPTVLAESPVVYHPAADNYDVTLRVAAKSSYTLKKMELLSDDEAVLETRALENTQSSQDFAIRGILSAVTPGAYEKTYYTRTADASGQTLSQYKIFQVAVKDAAVSGTVREKSSPVIDLTSLGLLPGGAAVLQETTNWGTRLYHDYVERNDQSGPIATAPPPTAQVQIYVQTGDTPLTLGAESLVYSHTDFTRLVQAGDTVPPGCANAGETVPADTRVACFVSVASAISLKRYVKVHAVGTQEQTDGIYSCYQLSPDNPDYCLNGSKYPELVLSGDLSGMIRGLAHVDSMAALAGAPGTYLAAGQNVSVSLGDILTVTFANVAQPGYLSAAFVTPQGYPGLAPLASFLLNAPEPAVYSGQIGFTVKYPAGLSAGQEGGITAYQIVTDPQSGVRLMKPLAAQINTAAKEVSFYADSLGEFLVAAPKYTTPWTLESAPAPDGQPELSAISNNGALSQRMLEPGSQEARDAGALLAGMNLFPAGNIFHVGPDDTALEPAAALKMRYTDADLEDRGLTESELGLYEFSADAKVMMKLPNQVLDPVRNEITGEVSHLYSLFAILGSSRGEQVPLGEDTTPPVTNAVPSVPPYQSGGMVFVSTAADIYLDAYDPEVAGAATSGVDNTDYVLDLAEGQPEVPVLYTGPLRLSEGMHTLGFASWDKRSNDEEKRTATFYADGTPPVSTCAVIGEGSVDNGNLVLVEGSSIAISAVDPENQGFASGLGMIVFDISTSPCTGFTDYPSAPGQCRKLLYTGAFSLGVGTHTLYYAAMDNVGNMAPVRKANIMVDHASSGLDLTPPVVTAWLGGEVVMPGSTIYMAVSDTITITALDDSGASNIYYTLDVMYSSDTAVYYQEPINISVGFHTLYYAAYDKVGNQSEIGRLDLLAGNTDVSCGELIVRDTFLAADLDCGGTSGDAVIIGAAGITLDGGGHRIISNNTASAINLNGKSSVTIKNVDVSGPYGTFTGSGVKVHASKDCVLENITAHNRAIGIEGRWNNENILIRGNNLSGNLTALMVYGSTMTIIGNSLGDSNYGLAVCGTGLALSSDNDYSGSTTAIQISYFSDITLENLVLRNLVGIEASAGSGLHLRNIDVSGPVGVRSGSGIKVNKVKDSVVENITAHNRAIGIEGRWGNENVVFRGNNLSDNDIALITHGATITVTGNNLGNSKYGVSAGGMNLILFPDNDYSGSTTAIQLGYFSDITLENLVLRNPVGIEVSVGTRLHLRNIDASGPVGARSGSGIKVNKVTDSVVENITAHNRAIGIEGRWGNENIVFRGNNLSNNDIALASYGSTLTITTNNLANSGFGLLAVGSNLVLKSDNDFTGSSTAITLVELTDSVIENLILNNNRGIAGGNLKRVLFKNLDLSGNGGIGIELNKTESSIFESITAHGRDVGVKVYDRSSNSVIRNNNLSGNRIALEVGGATMTVAGNILSNSGGGLGASGSNLILAGDNDFTGSSTAVHLGYLEDSVIENLVLDNPIGIAGGASKRLVFRNLDLSGTGGKGMEFNNTEGAIYESIMARGRDVGLKITGVNSNSIIKNNTLIGNKVGLQISGSTLTVSGNNLGGNSVVGLSVVNAVNLVVSSGNVFAGSAMGVGIGDSNGAILENGIIDSLLGINVYGSNNISLRNLNLTGVAGARAGTGVYVTNSSAIRMSNIAVANHDTAIKFEGTCSGHTLTNNTIANNNTGVVIPNGCTNVSISNSVLWGNNDDLQDQSGSVLVSYSDIQEVAFPGVGNLQVSPLFISTSSGDFRLNPWSPCVDAGSNIGIGAEDLDIFGNMRIFDGNRDGNAVVDMGAYESQIGVSSPLISGVYPSSGTAGDTVSLMGSGFGVYSPAVSQLYIATYPATVISWTDTRIDARVPALLAPGAYEIFLRTILGGFVSEASFAGFIVLPKVNSSVDGLVAIETPGVDIEVSAISTTSITSTMTLYGAMVDAGLEPVQDAFYEFSPSGTQFASPAVLMFRFNPVEVDTNTLAIYYFDGVVWSSTSILNQTVVYESPIVAYLQGEILHTSLYAMLRVNNTSGVALDLQPETLNLKSKGGVVTGYLRALQTPAECFAIKTVKISAVNGEKLPEPIFALTTDANDVACSSAAVKFSREALASVLSASDRVTISVAGRLESGRYFSADDTMRVIRPVRVSEDNLVSPSAAALEFKLGSVYVYPDPARGGKVPVFHIEVGKADSVKIRVFTVAGQQIHERVLTGSPLFVGQAYAYEYPWGGHIASGVYYYTIEADRAGKKLKTRGRFSVVR